MKRRILVTGSLIAAGLIWAATVGAMYHAVRQFESTPGRGATVRTMWPARSRIVPERNRWTLVMLHSSALQLHARQPSGTGADHREVRSIAADVRARLSPF
jgi:hypothetical protein